MSKNLHDHATRELNNSGVGTDEYGEMVYKDVMDLVDLFASQGHSGFSASMTLDLFTKVANFKNITPLTYADDEWTKHSEDMGGLWQNNRDSAVFTDDGAKTWWSVNDPDLTRNPCAVEAQR